MVRGAGVLGLAGADIESEIRASVLRSLTLDAVIVTTTDEAAFAAEKPGERAVISNYDDSGYSFDTKWKFYRPPYSAQITADSRTTLEINALTGYVDKEQLGAILRETLLIVLLTVMAAFLVLMLDVIVFSGNTVTGREENGPKYSEPVFDDEPAEPAYKPENEPSESVFDDEAEKESLELFYDETANEPPELAFDDEPAFDEEEEEPAGMYLGLIQKLYKELADDDEEGADVVLLCVEWTRNSFADANDGTPLFKQIAEEAAVFFNVKRISAFKRGENGIFILLPGVEFKHGLKAVREFHGRILDNDAFNTAITNFYAGFTSRAGREIEPERLILEAEKAVEKAKEDPDQPIVAFKADPSKYRDYLKNR
jgi:hypothetical protein